MEFKLNIKLGNEAMRSPSDVASALANLAEWLPFVANDSRLLPNLTGAIRDANGNTVGSWEVTE